MMIGYLLPEKAAVVQQLGHPAAGVIGWWDPAQNTSGEAVTESTALTYSAIWCATRVISETVASLPCLLYRRRADGGKERADDDSRFSLMHDAVSEELTAFTFFEVSTKHIVNRGNSYSKIVRDGMNRPQSLELRQPDNVVIEQDNQTFDIFYQVHKPVKEIVQRPDMLHVKGLGDDGIQGLSVIKKAAQAFGTAIATEKYAGSVFGNSAQPKGALVHPTRLSKEAREQFRKEWNEIHQGSDKANKVAILHGGLDYKQMGMSNEDAQFLESRKFSVNEIARWYRLPPMMLMDLERATFTNSEQQSQHFLSYSILPWLRRWESQLNRQLLSRTEQGDLFYEFMIHGLLRADIKSRFDAYSIGRQWGWLSVNDIRHFENLNPVENGDDYLQPMNMTVIGETELPQSIGRDWQNNVEDSLSSIRQAAQQLKTHIEGNGHNRLDEFFEAHEREMQQLRSDRTEIKKEIAQLGTTTVVSLDTQKVKQKVTELYQRALANCLTIESAKAQKAARATVERGTSFVSWLDGFYEDFERDVASRLAGAVELDAILEDYDSTERVKELAAAHCSDSKESLLDASDGDPAQFAERVAALVESWMQTRTKQEL